MPRQVNKTNVAIIHESCNVHVVIEYMYLPVTCRPTVTSVCCRMENLKRTTEILVAVIPYGEQLA